MWMKLKENDSHCQKKKIKRNKMKNNVNLIGRRK